MGILKAIDRFISFLVHGFVWVLMNTVFRLFYGLKAYGEENIPRKGGFILMANHASFLDPLIIGGSTGVRRFRYMARSTLFTPLTGWLFRWMGAFPVKRGAVDRNAWGKLIDLVQSGYPVTFFPEGTRTPDGEVKDGKPGAGMLIYSAKTTVLPVYLHGTYDAYPKGSKFPKFFVKLAVVFGKPITFDEYFDKEGTKEAYIEMTAKVISAIRALREEYLKAHK